MELIKIFVSYSHEDKDFAQKLFKALTAVGIDNFIDSKIIFNENYHSKIEDVIRESSHFLCLVNRSSLSSRWVHHEINLARKYEKKIIPVLLQPDVQLEPTFDNNIQYIQMHDKDLSEQTLIERLIDANMFGDGIVPVGLFRKYKHRFPNEYFASELLTQPIFLRCKEDKSVVVINRSEVKYVVISNVGKEKICEQYVSPKRDKLINLDRKILNFMRDPQKQTPPPIPTLEMPLRWASGGVLSIVRQNNNYWVPLFFRDIRPYGWNISLGASERYFDNQGKEIEDEDYSLEYELSHPWKFLVREFLEETLILDTQPVLGGKCKWSRFDFPRHTQIKIEQKQSEEFAQNHLNLRRNEDGLNISLSSEKIRLKIQDDAASDLEISGSQSNKDSPGIWDVLIAINPIELGIEIIKIFEYTLPSQYCILDGEVDLISHHLQMVRMPIALISLEYLYNIFGASDYQLKFDDKDVQPSVIAKPFEQEDIRVFPWDFEQRVRVWGGSSGNNWEKKQYAEWQKYFEKAFIDGLNGNKSKFPSLFTPATAKAMNLFFNCSIRGQAIAREYK